MKEYMPEVIACMNEICVQLSGIRNELHNVNENLNTMCYGEDECIAGIETELKEMNGEHGLYKILESIRNRIEEIGNVRVMDTK